MNRRRAELFLLLLATIIVVSLYALASLGRTASLPGNLAGFLVIVLVLFGVAHGVTRCLASNASAVLLPLAALLNGVGYVFIARLAPHLAGLQAMWTALGVAAYVATLVIIRDVRRLARYRYTLLVVGAALLLLPLTPVLGQNINGSRVWVRVAGISFEPSEFAKVAFAVFFAAYLAERREVLGVAARRIGPITVPELRHFGPLGLAWAVSMLMLVAERDIGASAIFFSLFLATLWVATGRTSYLGVGAAAFGLGMAVCVMIFPHVHERFTVWLHPWQHAQGSAYQSVQGIFALAWGGIAGTGLGLGNPTRIPVVATDFIFAAIGEELGLLGTVAVVASFLLLVGVGLGVASRTRESFETLLAVGLTTVLGVQAFVIMAGVTRLLPLTGVTLPFVSYGGSSLLANYVLLGLLVRMSATKVTLDTAQDLTMIGHNSQLRPS